MPHTGAQDQSRSEHFLQNGGCTVEAQDSGLLDGVVVLIEGEGAGVQDDELLKYKRKGTE